MIESCENLASSDPAFRESDIRAFVRFLTEPSQVSLAERRRQVASDFADLIGTDGWRWLRYRKENDTWLELESSPVVSSDNSVLWPAATPDYWAEAQGAVSAGVGSVDELELADSPASSVFGMVRDAWPISPVIESTQCGDKGRILCSVSRHAGGDDLSVWQFMRAEGAVFSARERALLALFAWRIPWLHAVALPVDESAEEEAVKLSPRLQEVLNLLLGEKRRREVAETLGVKAQTVDGYVKQVYRTMKVSGRTELLRLHAQGNLPDVKN